MTLTPPHFIGELLDAYRFVSGHDAAPRPLDPPIDSGHIISAAQQDCLQDSCARGPRTVRRDPLGELVRERAEHVTERHHRSGQLLQRHAEQTTCPRWRQFEIQALDRTVSLDDIAGLGHARDEGRGVAAECRANVDDDRDHPVGVLDPAILTCRVVDEPDVSPGKVLPKRGVDRQDLCDWTRSRRCGRSADHGKPPALTAKLQADDPGTGSAYGSSTRRRSPTRPLRRKRLAESGGRQHACSGHLPQCGYEVVVQLAESATAPSTFEPRAAAHPGECVLILESACLIWITAPVSRGHAGQRSARYRKRMATEYGWAPAGRASAWVGWGVSLTESLGTGQPATRVRAAWKGRPYVACPGPVRVPRPAGRRAGLHADGDANRPWRQRHSTG